MAGNVNAKNLQIIKKSLEGADKKYLLKLNRAENFLEVFERVTNDKLKEYHSIREDFDSSGYVMFEKMKSIKCIYGAVDTPTPYGICNVEQKSKDCYVSEYHKKFQQVKFFGYMVIFEDYFIHSNMYLMDVDEEMMRSGNRACINVDDKYTAGCIRVPQEELDWMLMNIEEKTIIVLA